MTRWSAHTVRCIARWALLLVLGLGWAGSAPAEAPQPADAPVHFERLDGLSHNTVFAVLQDQHGFLWIGTADGLNRYDGYDVTVYRHLPGDSTSLVDNTVQALAEAPNGDLWVGTASGLDRLDRSTGRFVHYDLMPDATDPPKNIAQVVRDGAGRLWVRTYLDGHLYRYDRAAGAFERFEGGWQPGSVAMMEIGPEGQIWVVGAAPLGGSAPSMLYRFDAAQYRFHPLVELRGGALHAGASGTLWMGGVTETPDTVRAPVRRLDAPVPWGQERNAVQETRDGTVWIGTSRGLHRFDPATGTSQHHLIDTTGTAGLSNYVLGLFEDRSGILWVGTRSGLYRHDPHRKPFRHLGPSSGRLRGSSQSAVMALHEAAGTLWAGTLGGGLVRLQTESSTYRADGRASGLPSNEVWALYEDRAGRLWVGTEAGACVMNSQRPRCETSITGSARPLPSGPIYTFAEEPDGTLWMGGTALYRVNPRTGRVETPVDLEYGSDFSTIQALHTDGAGRLWIGMEGGGLARYDIRRDTLIRDAGTELDGAPRGLQETIWVIHQSARGPLWLGTDLGLVEIDPAAGTHTRHFDADQLLGSIVYSILEDGRGQLWLGTSQGLVRFDPRTEQFRRYDASDGVRNTEFNRRAAHAGPDGLFFFGGLRGITAFDPSAIRDNPYVPPVAITRMTKVNRDTTATLNPLGREHLTLDYRDRVFTFEFAALSFTSPEKNQYAYRLDGFEADWVEAGTRRTVRYTNVPPGEYTFRVKGSNNDGIWNEAGASMRVTIAPPFWQTTWFRLLMGMLLVGALAVVYRLRVQHLLAMERLRLRIASDLHDDVGSQLASVAITSDVLRAQDDLSAATHAELRHIGSVVRQTAEALRDIVWFVDPEHDDPESLLWKMKNEAARLLSEVDYTFDHPPLDQITVLEQMDVRVRRNLFLIFKEALHNIVRHARAKTVRIALRCHSERIELTVSDDGIGLDPGEDESSGQGLKNMHHRTEEMGAELELTCRPEGGTTLRLTVPAA